MPDAASLLLGIDAGTSVVKAALFDRDGAQVAATRRRTELSHPRPLWSETGMDETWEATAATVRDLLDGVDPTAVAAVGIAGNMVGAWMIDAEGRPVRDAVLWNDGRSQALIERLDAGSPGLLSRIFAVSGSVMQQGCTLPVMRWLADHEPEALARARAVFGCKDWLRFRLTGTVATDPTEASVAPGDGRARDRSEAMFDLFGLAPHRRLFPEVRPSQSIAGAVTDEAARRTGLAAGTPVAVGAGDVAASALGVGVGRPGLACTLLGTNILNCVAVDRPVFEPADLGLLFCLPDRLWLRAMVNVAGTSNLDWFLDRFCAAERAAAGGPEALFAALEPGIRASGPGARGVVYLPYLSANGIIAPVVEPAARAEFFGLSEEHGLSDLLRAVYEGVALSIREGFDVLPVSVDEIRLSGGGARSALWCQIIADATGRTVTVPEGDEFGAKGAALLAGVGIGWYPSPEAAALATAAIARRHAPDDATRRAYDGLNATYGALRDALRPVWRRHAAEFRGQAGSDRASF